MLMKTFSSMALSNMLIYGLVPSIGETSIPPAPCWCIDGGAENEATSTTLDCCCGCWNNMLLTKVLFSSNDFGTGKLDDKGLGIDSAWGLVWFNLAIARFSRAIWDSRWLMSDSKFVQSWLHNPHTKLLILLRFWVKSPPMLIDDGFGINY